ncbi:membrane protein [Staphylococcus aureus]|nr:membrane protein [Staphylococcus aureus]
MNLREIVGNIKRPYLTPLIIFTILISLFFDAIMFFNSKLYDKLPIYLVIFLVFGILVSVLLYIQEKGEKIKVEKKNVNWYLTLNVIAGYSMPLFITSGYVVGATVYGTDVLNYWCGIILTLFVSWFALFLFYKNEFDSENPNKAVNVIVIIIKLSALGLIFYISIIAPSVEDEKNFIFVSILINIAVDALLVRSYFNYALYKSVKKDIENGVDD